MSPTHTRVKANAHTILVGEHLRKIPHFEDLDIDEITTDKLTNSMEPNPPR
jgi:hypothetical protein